MYLEAEGGDRKWRRHGLGLRLHLCFVDAVVQLLSHVLLCDLMDCSPPGPVSMGFPRKEYWSGLPFPIPGDFTDPGIRPKSSALAGRFFTTEPPGKTPSGFRWCFLAQHHLTVALVLQHKLLAWLAASFVYFLLMDVYILTVKHLHIMKCLTC